MRGWGEGRKRERARGDKLKETKERRKERRDERNERKRQEKTNRRMCWLLAWNDKQDSTLDHVSVLPEALMEVN